MERIVLDPVIEYLDGPTIQHVRDVLVLRMNRYFDRYITTCNALRTFWIKIHRRTSHPANADVFSCYDVNRWKSLTWWPVISMYMMHNNSKMRDNARLWFGECEKKKHLAFCAFFHPVKDGESTRELYTKWRSLAYERFAKRKRTSSTSRK